MSEKDFQEPLNHNTYPIALPHLYARPDLLESLKTQILRKRFGEKPDRPTPQKRTSIFSANGNKDLSFVQHSAPNEHWAH